MAIINQVVSGGGSGLTGLYREFEIDVQGTLIPSTTTTHIMDFTGVKSFSPTEEIKCMYQNNTNISGVVNMPDVITLFGNLMFSGCSGITGANIPKATSATSSSACYNMFSNSGIRFLNLPSFTSSSAGSIFSSMCEGCVYLTDVNISSLERVSAANQLQNMFKGCTSLVTMRYESLLQIGSNTLNSTYMNCTALESLWFYVLTTVGNVNAMTNMLSGCSGVSLHFPKVLDPQSGSTVISSLTGYPNFGGTNTTVLFDLVTSLTGADGNTYTRREKKSTSTATAWMYNDTLYYTSGVSDNTNGVNEPSVSDAIYSDAACTQSVTTISAIA